MSCFKNRLTIFILRLAFSHVGLCILVSGYMVAGAYLFQWIELPGEQQRFERSRNLSLEIASDRQWLVEVVKEFCSENSTVGDDTAVIYVKLMLDAYQKRIIDARQETQNWGRQAYRGDVLTPIYGWETVSAILFTATICTTIGYGHITPVTETGYMVFIFYAVFAIPLMSMYLVNISELLIAVIRYGYHRGCCFYLERRRQQEHYWLSTHRTLWTTEFDPDAYYKVQTRHHHQSAWAAAAEMGHRHHEELLLKRLRTENLTPGSLAVLLWSMYLISGALLFAFWEDGWTLIESFYFVVVTLLTIGFGDLIPGLKRSNTPKGQLQFGIVTIYIVLGIALVATLGKLIYIAVEEHTRKHKALIMEKLENARRLKFGPRDIYDNEDNVIESISTRPYAH